MKSNKEALSSRGFVSEETEKAFQKASQEELFVLLQDKQPVYRTIAARRLGYSGNPDSVIHLCIALEKETKLYPKLEICNSLILFGIDAVPHLIARLGKIGNNQHMKPAEEKFKKKNYPLLRDIAGRTLMRIGKPALPALLETLKTDDLPVISEAIDTIGYICFYDRQPHIFSYLMRCYEKYNDKELIRWKIVRALSAFPESRDFLEQLYRQEKNTGVLREIERSLFLIKK